MSENSSASDWIYILLTLFVAGISLLRSGTSKNKKHDRPASVPHEAREKEEWITEEPEEFEEDDYAVEENTKEVVGGDYYRGRKEEPIVFSEEKREDEQEEPIFDARKAFISSEIFNRKYN